MHQVVREHLERFLATTARADPSRLPTFLEAPRYLIFTPHEFLERLAAITPSTSHQYGPLPRRPGSARSVAPAGTECAHDPCTAGTAALTRASGRARRRRADTDVIIVGIGRRGPPTPSRRADDPDVTRCLTSGAECRTDASRLGMGRLDAESICH